MSVLELMGSQQREASTVMWPLWLQHSGSAGGSDPNSYAESRKPSKVSRGKGGSNHHLLTSATHIDPIMFSDVHLESETLEFLQHSPLIPQTFGPHPGRHRFSATAWGRPNGHFLFSGPAEQFMLPSFLYFLLCEYT